MTRDQIIETVARGWTHPETEYLTMDPALAYAIVEEIMQINISPNLGCATTKELIHELAARAHTAETVGKTWLSYRTIDSV